MKEKVRLWVLVLLGLALYFGVIVLAVGEVEKEPAAVKVRTSANEQYGGLLERVVKEERWGDSELPSVRYAEYYGGAYIKKKLVVCVAQKFAQDPRAYEYVLREIREATGNPDITVEIVPYSLNELLETQYEIIRLKKEHAWKKGGDYEVIRSSVSSYTDETRNRLVVGIDEMTDEKVAAYKRLFPKAGFIEFVPDDFDRYVSTTS